MPSLLLLPPSPLPASLHLHLRLVSPHPLLRPDRTHSVNLTQKMTCPSNRSSAYPINTTARGFIVPSGLFELATLAV